MLKAEQVPYEVKLRLRNVLLDGETDEAVAIAAALNAWTGAELLRRKNGQGKGIFLPLAKETSA